MTSRKRELGPIRLPIAWTERTWDMDAPEAVHFALHFVWPILIVVAGVLLVSAVLDATPQYCAVKSDNVLPNNLIVVAGIVALVLGREVSNWSQPRGYAYRPNWNRAIFYGAWFWLFILMAAIWFYEAMGTAHVVANTVTEVTFEPITYYVRCAANEDLAKNGFAVWTTFVVAVVSGIVGHWLWAAHPPGGRRPTHESGRGTP